MIARPKDMPREIAAIATLDMRIDYMGAAEPGKDVHASAHCFKADQKCRLRTRRRLHNNRR